MGALLSTTNRRASRCPESVDVGGGTGAYLQCDLTEGHPGPLHYDRADGIWWCVT